MLKPPTLVNIISPPNPKFYVIQGSFNSLIRFTLSRFFLCLHTPANFVHASILIGCCLVHDVTVHVIYSLHVYMHGTGTPSSWHVQLV